MNTIYVRPVDAKRVRTIERKFPNAVTDPRSEFYAAEQESCLSESSIAELSALSAKLQAEVIWLSFQSAVDAFAFCHWESGKLLRALVYGCWGEERTWDRVEGQPEPWERAALFPEGMLEFMLIDVTGAEAERYKRIWCDAKIIVGSSDPSIDAKESARAAGQFYYLPHWFAHPPRV